MYMGSIGPSQIHFVTIYAYWFTKVVHYRGDIAEQQKSEYIDRIFI